MGYCTDTEQGRTRPARTGVRYECQFPGGGVQMWGGDSDDPPTPKVRPTKSCLTREEIEEGIAMIPEHSNIVVLRWARV